MAAQGMEKDNIPVLVPVPAPAPEPLPEVLDGITIDALGRTLAPGWTLGDSVPEGCVVTLRLAHRFETSVPDGDWCKVAEETREKLREVVMDLFVQLRHTLAAKVKAAPNLRDATVMLVVRVVPIEAPHTHYGEWRLGLEGVPDLTKGVVKRRMVKMFTDEAAKMSAGILAGQAAYTTLETAEIKAGSTVKRR